MCAPVYFYLSTHDLDMTGHFEIHYCLSLCELRLEISHVTETLVCEFVCNHRVKFSKFVDSYVDRILTNCNHVKYTLF